MKRAVVMVGLVSLCLSSVPAAAADANDGKTSPEPLVAAVEPALMVASELPRGLNAELPREMKRSSSLLPAMYVTFGVVQAWDVYTTSAALKNGGHEINPITAPFAGSAAKMIGIKAATGAATIYFTEKLRRQNKVAAVAVMAGINSGLAMVAARNARLAR